jgi:ferric enterobactin receptor
MTCVQALELLKSRYELLIAYSGTLSELTAKENKIIEGADSHIVMEKVCATFNLDYVKQGNTSFLVRSDANDVYHSKEFNLHLKIRDESNGERLPYVSVYDETFHYFAFTDEFGDCILKLPKSLAGKKLTIHSLAHNDHQLVINPEKNFAEIQLSVAPIAITVVTVQTLHKNIKFNDDQAVSLNKRFLDHLANSSVFLNDASRSIQLVSGVTAHDDSKASLRIRGSQEEATLLVLDEMPIYKADHFYGLFGAFNSKFIHEISLYKNNIPVSFGGRTSGMLQLKSTDKIDKFNASLDLNLLNSGISLNAPITKGLGVKFAARKTYTNLIDSKFYDLSMRNNLESDEPRNTSNSVVSSPSFDFYDMNGKIFFSHKNHHLDLNFFRSSDHFSDKYESTFKIRNLTVNEETFNQENFWDNKTVGLNYRFENNDFLLTSHFYQTGFSSSYDINSRLFQRTMTGIIRDTVTIENANEIIDKGMKFSFNSKRSVHWMIGVEHVSHDNVLYIENNRNTTFEINQIGAESGLFSSVDLGSKDKLYIKPSFRATYLHGLDKTYFLPQIFMSYQVGNQWMLKSSAGKHAQYVRQFEHESILGQKQSFFALSNGKNIPVGIGTNFMFGISKFWDKFSLDFESYYRTLDGAIIHASQRPGLRLFNMQAPPQNFKLFRGEGKVYGADLSLSYEQKAWFSMLNYTLSKSENRFKEIFNNQFFPSSEDSRHQLKWLNSYSYRDFNFSLHYISASGRPYLDLSALGNNMDRNNLDISKSIRNLPAYHRVDVGVTYQFNLFYNVSKIGFTVFNLFDRTNVKYKQFVFQLPPTQGSNNNLVNTILGSDVSQLDRTYNISLQINFSKK